MNTQAPQTDWRLSEPLVERVAWLRSQGGDRTGGRAGSAERERATRWREQFPFGDTQPFAQRLAAAEITPAEFQAALDLVSLPRSGSPPPAWAQTLLEAYKNEQAAGWSPTGFTPAQTDALYPLLRCAAPLMDHFAAALREQAIGLVGDAESPFNGQEVPRLFVGELVNAFKQMLAPTILLELNLARLGGQLVGANPAERFDNFFSGLNNCAAAMRLLARYPVLARQLVVRGGHWLASSVAFLRDLTDDWPAIRSWLDPNSEHARLAGIQAHLGDSHCGGRSVVIASFESGLRLVYKPRSLAVDKHFQDLLCWLGARVSDLTFTGPKILDRGTHGWMEFVQAADCDSTDGVRRFYERQGGYLALLYLLNGSDFHCENVIAAGEHPILVDVEALFHTRVPADRRSIHGVAVHGWDASVLRTGLLPTPIRWAEDDQPLDRSGIGAPQGQLSPLAVLCPQGVGTDEMQLVRKRLAIRPSAHCPTVAGQRSEQIDVDAVVRGFGKVYHAVQAHRDDLLAADGPLARFSGDDIRVVLRHTLIYSRLLAESFHPDLLRDALDRDQLFDLLWADVPHNPHLGRIVVDECRDLWNGDIPLFRGHVGSRAVETSSGRVIPDFFPQPTDAPVRRRLREMNDTDFDRQTWLIRGSLATLSPGRINATRELRPQPSPRGAHTIRDRLMAQACRIGDRLETLAMRSGDEAGWIGITHEAKDEWSLRPVGPSLYDGTAGIVLFLAHLGDVTGDQRYRNLAAAAARNLSNQVAALPPAALGIGAFSGVGGLFYLYSHVAVLWDQPQWIDSAGGMVDAVIALIEEDSMHDLMGGAAGCIAGLLALYAVAPSDKVVAAAIASGDHLLRSARPTTPGIGWPSALYGVPLAGLSHGASGIASSLFALDRLTGQTRFGDAASAALDYERSLFDSQQGHWADLRPRESRSRTPMVAWCHGAAGIGLSRLSMLSSVDPSTGRSEIAIAVDATLAWGFGDNHCLCHGDLGNLDFLLQAGQALGKRPWNVAVERLTLRILDDIEHNGWRCGINKPVDTPGLMTGLAGIGYGILRLANRDTVPAVTTLCAPCVTASPE